MTGQELLEKLQALTPEERSLEVYDYLPDYEDGEYAGAPHVVTKDEAPYEKSDTPWLKYGLPDDQKLLYI